MEGPFFNHLPEGEPLILIDIDSGVRQLLAQLGLFISENEDQ